MLCHFQGQWRDWLGGEQAARHSRRKPDLASPSYTKWEGWLRKYSVMGLPVSAAALELLVCPEEPAEAATAQCLPTGPLPCPVSPPAGGPGVLRHECGRNWGRTDP